MNFLCISLLCILSSLVQAQFSLEFRQHLEKLQPIRVQPTKDIQAFVPLKPFSLQDIELLDQEYGTHLADTWLNDSRIPRYHYQPPIPVPDGEPITLSIGDLEALNSSYLNNLLELIDELDEPIPLPIDYETFARILYCVYHLDCFPQSTEKIEKILVAAGYLNIVIEKIIPYAIKINPSVLRAIYKKHAAEPAIYSLINASFQQYLNWQLVSLYEITDVSAVALSNDNKCLFAARGNGDIFMFDCNGKRFFQKIESKLTSLRISADNKYLVGLLKRNKLKIWNLTDQTLAYSTQLNDSDSFFPTYFAISPDCTFIAIHYQKKLSSYMCGDKIPPGFVELRDLATGSIQASKNYPNHEVFHTVTSGAITDDNQHVVCNISGTYIWDLKEKLICIEEDYGNYDFTYVIVAKHGYIIRAAGSQIRISCVGKILLNYCKLKDSCNLKTIVFSPDGNYVALATNKRIEIYHRQQLEDYLGSND